MESKTFIPTNSSLISSVKYSWLTRPDTTRIQERLNIQFCNGKELEYLVSGVGEVLFHDFETTPSVGKYWHRCVKDAYEYKVIRHGDATIGR